MFIQIKFVTLALGALFCASFGALSTYVALRFDRAEAPSTPPAVEEVVVAPKMKSLGYFLRHDSERADKIGYCENNPGIKLSDPECENARLADAKLGISTKEVLLPMFPE